MYQLASRFSRSAAQINRGRVLSEEEMRSVAPSIFAADAHDSRSERYTYIPTIEILNALRAEGFHPFMVAQTRVRDEAHKDHTKHMIRLRHATDIGQREANEVILLNSHNGSSSYQMLSGVFRFACANGMVCGNTHHDIRVPHKGDIKDQVLEGANVILESFDMISERKEMMEDTRLGREEQEVYARAALALRYDTSAGDPPIEAGQLLRARRIDDDDDTLWSTLNRVQENMIRGGLQGKKVNGRRRSTRAVTGIDQNVALNRGLWTLAEEMAKLQGKIKG